MFLNHQMHLKSKQSNRHYKLDHNVEIKKLFLNFQMHFINLKMFNLKSMLTL